MANDRNAGRKKKYKEGIETCKLQELIPVKRKSECLKAIEKIVAKEKRN